MRFALSFAVIGLFSLSAMAQRDVQEAGDAAPDQVRDNTAQRQILESEFIDNNGDRAGSVKLKSVPGGVLISLDLQNIEPGDHAFHVHETGDCSPLDTFAKSGGHFNPHGNDHGFHHGEDYVHAGDMGNISVASDGTFKADILNPFISMDTGEKNDILDNDGSALIIHAKADDYVSQPSGAAGDRIACALLTSDLVSDSDTADRTATE